MRDPGQRTQYAAPEPTPGAYAGSFMSSTERVREEFNADRSRKYRELDQEVIALGGAYAHYGAIVTRLSESFGRPIVALDLGCGTGRYFHCLKNVQRLVGSDLSADMLDQARNPIHAEQIDIESIELVAGDVFSAPLPEGDFDFVYSIGVLGEYTPIDSAVIDRLFRLARPGGDRVLHGDRCAFTGAGARDSEAGVCAARVSEAVSRTPQAAKAVAESVFFSLLHHASADGAPDAGFGICPLQDRPLRTPFRLARDATGYHRLENVGPARSRAVHATPCPGYCSSGIIWVTPMVYCTAAPSMPCTCSPLWCLPAAKWNAASWVASIPRRPSCAMAASA